MNKMGENDKLIAIISLAAGIAIGANWDKIKTALEPMISSFTQQASNVAEKGTTVVLKDNVAVYDEGIEDNKAVSISCSQCQTKLKSTAKFCYKCGEKL